MANLKNNSESIHIMRSQIQTDFLELLLTSEEDATYPWDTSNVETEEFFAMNEAHFPMHELLQEELNHRADSFFNHLDSLWSQLPTTQYHNCNTSGNILVRLQESLQKWTQAGLPQAWLEKIASKANEIMDSQQSLGEQLALCANCVLPTWGTDDLLVLARPFAYEMRNSETQTTGTDPQPVISALNKVSDRDWNSLTEIDQARVSLAVAYYALRQLNSTNE